MKEVNIMEMTVNVKDCREFVEDSLQSFTLTVISIILTSFMYF